MTELEQEMEAALSAADGDLGTDADRAEVKKSLKRRVRAALAMMLAGARDDEIADVLNYSSPAAARAAWQEAMANIVDPKMDLRSAREVAKARLMGGMKALAPRALNEFVYEDRDDPNNPGKTKRVKVRNEELPAYSQIYLRYLDRMIRLEGLDAPQVMTLITPAAVDFENFVAKVLAESGVKQIEEGDIWDAEVVDDDAEG